MASLERLSALVRQGRADTEPAAVSDALSGLFEDRYHKRHFVDSMVRSDSYRAEVPYAGLINPENPMSGAYGGASLVWFPQPEGGSLVAFVVGTRGISPDEGILTRPGHRRRLRSLRKYLSGLGCYAWTKPDPAALTVGVPNSVTKRFPGTDRIFARYGNEVYCVTHIPADMAHQTAEAVLQGFLDTYAFERGWEVKAVHRADFEALLGRLRNDIFPTTDAVEVNALLRQRRFVVLQGPPGTGKSRLANEVLRDQFAGQGMSVQFHPAVTYEDFIVGLSPDPAHGSLRFYVRKGWLLEACASALEHPFLLVIDEVNRADLGKVLGEGIYLFEAGEIGGKHARKVELAHAVDGTREFTLPDGLFVLCTMNTADRSIAGMDLAVRRRFAFVNMPPDRSVIERQSSDLALKAFDELFDLFVEHAPDDSLDLLPGHAYFLGSSDDEVKDRFQYELLPLLDEYLREAYLGPATTDLSAVRDSIADAIR
jgi:5-methylcytosine-specific restriction protein B